MTDIDIQHKTDFEKFILAEQNGPMRACVQGLYAKWRDYNRDFFHSELVIPTYILLGTPTKPSVLGQYAPVSSFGGTSEIRIRPTLFTGKHPSINARAPMEGRKRFLFDVLLHEMVHQFSHEILNKPEGSYKGHGPVFRDECNRISDLLGIKQEVRTCKKRGKNADLPSCAYWPWCVRPPDYYMGAWIEKQETQKTDPKPDPPEEPDEPAKLSYDEILKLVNESLDDNEKKRLSDEIIPPGYRFCFADGKYIRASDIPALVIDGLKPQQLYDVAEELVQVRRLFDYERSWNPEQCDGFDYTGVFLAGIIARDRIDISARLKAGEYETVREAAVDAGILTKEKDFFFDIKDTDKWFDAAMYAFTPEEMFMLAREFENWADNCLRWKFEIEHPDDYEKKLEEEIYRLEALVGK